MAYTKRTWLGRQGTGLNKFSIGGASPVTIVNQPDSVTQVGDALSAGNLNDLEDRIEDAFDDVDTALDTKADEQDVTNLNNALTAIDHRVQNLEQAHGSYEVKNYKDGSITPSGKGNWAVVEGLRGVSRVENQLIRNGNFDGTTNWASVNTSLTTFTVANNVATVTMKADVPATGQYNYGIRQTFGKTIAGHKYLIRSRVKSEGTGLLYDFDNSTTGKSITLTPNVWTDFIVLTDGVASNSGVFYIMPDTGLLTDQSFQVTGVVITDLTLYFNGTIPSDADTIAEIQQNYPHLLTPSEYGVRIVDSSYSGVRAWARNLVDPSAITPNKYVDDGSGNLMSNSTYVATDYLPVVPNKTYYYKTDESRGRWGAWYDENKVYISGISGSGEKTAPSNAKYARVTGCTDNYLTTLCFSLSGSLDGTFTEYHAPDTLSLTFQGKSAGSVYDSCEPNVEVGGVARRRDTTRISPTGFDLGTITSWVYDSTYARFRALLPSGLGIKVPSSARTEAVLIPPYICKYNEEAFDSAWDMVVYLVQENGTAIYIHDHRYNASSLVNGQAPWLDGVLMYYPLATESVTLSDPLLDNTLLTESGGRMATVQTGTVVDGSFDLGFITL